MPVILCCMNNSKLNVYEPFNSKKLNSNKLTKKPGSKYFTVYNHYFSANDIVISNQVLRKIKNVVKSDVKNWAYISLR